MPVNQADSFTTRAEQLNALNAMIASGGSLYHPTLHLAQGIFAPGPNLTLAGLTEATFDGYSASAALAWDGAYIGDDGLVHVTSPGTLFVKGVGSVTNTIYGAYITDAGGTNLLAAGLFPTPVVLLVPNDGVMAVVDYVWGN